MMPRPRRKRTPTTPSGRPVAPRRRTPPTTPSGTSRGSTPIAPGTGNRTPGPMPRCRMAGTDRRSQILAALLETPELAGEFYRRFLSRLLALETRLFERAFAERSRVRGAKSPDAGVVARSFHGSILFYNIAGAIMRIEPLPRDPETLAAAL